MDVIYQLTLASAAQGLYFRVYFPFTKFEISLM